jgi:hypothetical protein
VKQNTKETMRRKGGERKTTSENNEKEIEIGRWERRGEKVVAKGLDGDGR